MQAYHELDIRSHVGIVIAVAGMAHPQRGPQGQPCAMLLFIFVIIHAVGNLHIFISAITLLTLVTIHIFQSRFGEMELFKLCPPPYLLNIGTSFRLCFIFFWVDTPGCPAAEVPAICRMDFEAFKSSVWGRFDLFAVIVFGLEGGARAVLRHPEPLPPKGEPRGLRDDGLHRLGVRMLPAQLMGGCARRWRRLWADAGVAERDKNEGAGQNAGRIPHESTSRAPEAACMRT